MSELEILRRAVVLMAERAADAHAAISGSRRKTSLACQHLKRLERIAVDALAVSFVPSDGRATQHGDKP